VEETMLTYATPADATHGKGLRIVLVQGLPSPWGQAAKTFFEIKGLDYLAAPLVPGGENAELVAWAGENSGPLVAWNDEKPIHRWVDILYLAERLAPTPALIPSDPMDRALMIGLSHEICGELGIGWNRRLQMIAPQMESGNPAEAVANMGAKYRYDNADFRAAGARTAASLTALANQLRTQQARGRNYFVGDGLTAVDIYWTAFANLLDPLPPDLCPIPEGWRPAFVVTDPQIKAALDPILLTHRDRIFTAHFRKPMEF
jgi:glutathione S-transferase